ncbi:unnamed protein product [Camellia sinensis]
MFHGTFSSNTKQGRSFIRMDVPLHGSLRWLSRSSHSFHASMRKANAIGAILGTTIGYILGIIIWLSVASVEYGRVNLDKTGRNAPMLAGNIVSILTCGAIHAVCSFLWPQNYDWDTTKYITMVEKEKSELPAEEFKEEKLIRAKVWIVKWGVGFAVMIVLLWPLLSLPAEQFSEGYCTFWAIIAMAWGTIGSVAIIVLSLTEKSNLKLHTIMLAILEAEKIYLLEKGKAKKNEASEPDAHIVPS